jgi:hypothetical protein
VQVVCNMLLESSRQALQLWFRPHPNRRSAQEVIAPQSCKTPNLGDFGTLRTKNHLNAALARRCSVYYMGEGGGFPWVWVMVSFVSLRSPVARPCTKGVVALC